MLSILLGSDDFSKNEYVEKMAKEQGLPCEVFSDAENLPQVQNLASQDLFSKQKIFVLSGLLKFFPSEETVEKFISSKNHIIVTEEKLDKRLSETKTLLANSKITTKQFNLPHGKDLNMWIESRVKFLGGIIHPSATENLSIALGRDDAKETKFGGKVTSVEEIYSLWQADSEIKKLIAHANGREINTEDIHQLLSQNSEVDVFDLTNAVADGKKQEALELLHKFLRLQTGSDEKTAVIQLNALLSEQFRSIAMIQDFIESRTSETEILEATGWKSGRLFVMKKAASRFVAKKVLETMEKLRALDEELKTSSVPPKVLLDLIVTQLFI